MPKLIILVSIDVSQSQRIANHVRAPLAAYEGYSSAAYTDKWSNVEEAFLKLFVYQN